MVAPTNTTTYHLAEMFTTHALCGARLPFNGRVAQREEDVTCEACFVAAREREVKRSLAVLNQDTWADRIRRTVDEMNRQVSLSKSRIAAKSRIADMVMLDHLSRFL